MPCPAWHTVRSGAPSRVPNGRVRDGSSQEGPPPLGSTGPGRMCRPPALGDTQAPCPHLDQDFSEPLGLLDLRSWHQIK